jgi:hypothetical protein
MIDASLAALKERAGVVGALLDGRQTVLVRDPDLRPTDDDLDAPFALYPGYSHQDPERYHPQDRRYYHRSTTKPDGGVPLRAVCEPVADHRVPTDRLSALAPHYVYTEAGLREKYGLDDATETRVLLVRVHELADPRLIEERAAYRGCRSWISLAESVDTAAAQPVLDDAAFAERRAAVAAALE